MKKITTTEFLVNQIENQNLYQIDAKSLFANSYDNNTYNFFSYNTKIAEYDKITNILTITKKFYSRTTAKHKSLLKRHFNNLAKAEILEI